MHKMIFRVSTVLIAFMVLTVGLLVTVSPRAAVAADNNDVDAVHIHDTAGPGDVEITEFKLVKQTPESGQISRSENTQITYDVAITLTPKIKGEYYKRVDVVYSLVSADDENFFNVVDCPVGTENYPTDNHKEKACLRHYNFTNEGFAAPGTFTQTFVINTEDDLLDYSSNRLASYTLQPTIKAFVKGSDQRATVTTEPYIFMQPQKSYADDLYHWSYTRPDFLSVDEINGNRAYTNIFKFETSVNRFISPKSVTAYTCVQFFIKVGDGNIPLDESFIKVYQTEYELNELKGNVWKFGGVLSDREVKETAKILSSNGHVSLWDYYHIPRSQNIEIIAQSFDYGFSNTDLGITYVEDNSNQSSTTNDNATKSIVLPFFLLQQQPQHTVLS